MNCFHLYESVRWLQWRSQASWNTCLYDVFFLFWSLYHVPKARRQKNPVRKFAVFVRKCKYLM